ncbi:phage tail assembly protein [Tumebacillus lipolyticus]|uniref:Phage tail assembly protein n=1 Tax=Tumebacillus lipolyticus TaxID=1280370 RepID=A0ABW4ZYY5_9BACL
MAFKTEYEFILPKGYVDEEGNLHKRGVMRLATAADEILPMRDPRVQSNPGYLSIILLSRVISRLGELSAIDTRTVERFFTSDLAYLQDFYRQINEGDGVQVKTACPKCDHEFEVEMAFLPELSGA